MNNGYSICFNEWALDNDIKEELGLLLIISSLCAEKGYCYASNKYFAELFKTREETISRKIKKLQEKGYILTEYKRRGAEIKERLLRLTKISIDDCVFHQSTIDENVKENNISINNTSINILKEENIIKEEKLPFEEIIDYLNKATNSNYRFSTQKTKQLIKARFKEGFTLEDFKTVVDKKAMEWLNTEYEQYLRPETLFGTKFESYLNQKEKKRVRTTNDIKFDPEMFERSLRGE